MDDTTLYQVRINYYNQSRLYHTAQASCRDGLKKLGNNYEMHLWESISKLFLGRASDAIRGLQTLTSDRTVALAANLAMRDAHKQATHVDKDAIAVLDQQIKADVKSCGSQALYHGAVYLWQAGKHDKARDLTDRLLKLDKNSADGNSVRGWIDLTCGHETHSKRAIKNFEDSLRQTEEMPNSSNRIEPMFGKARCLLSMNKADQALELINEVIGYHGNYLPALVEKANCHAALSQWDEVEATTQRIFTSDPSDILSHRLVVLQLLSRVGDYTAASHALGDLIGSLDTMEPKNHRAYFDSAQFVSRLSGRHTDVLQQANTLLDRAIKIAKEAGKDDADYLVELGYSLTLTNAFHDAMNAYKRGMSIDETSISALTGVIMCQINNDQLQEASQQLEFLNEIQASLGRSVQLSYLTALLHSKQNDDVSAVIKHLDDAVNKQLADLETEVIGVSFFARTDPDLILQMAKLYLEYGPSDAPDAHHSASPVLIKAQRVLEKLSKMAPGLIEGVFLLAKVKYLSGAIDAAKSGIQYCLNLDNTFADAHLLMARINLAQGNPGAAAQSLEVGTSYNFEIRDSPLYFSTKASIEKSEGKIDACIDTLKKAFKLVQSKHNKKKPISDHDRVTIMLEYCDALWEGGKTHEAAKIMQDAMTAFKGKPEEIRIQIANADMSIKRGDIEEGLALLGSVTPAQSYYVQAKQRMADIYLHHRKDKALYAACYKELVDQNPTPHAYLLMGDAYMNIQDPESAIAVYEQALQKNPQDSVLGRKIGSALVKTHDYAKAVNYYEAALKSGAQSALRGDLADLYIKLKKYDKAERVLRAGLESTGSGDLVSLTADVKLLSISSRLRSETGGTGEALHDLMRAGNIQGDVLRRVEKEQPDMLQAQGDIATDICVRIAKLHQKLGNEKAAIDSYQKALTYNDSSEEALMSLAKLHIASNDLESAQRELGTLRRYHKDHAEAAMMLADIMYRKLDYDSATWHFQQLLDQKPEQYEALAYLIDLLRRDGKLADVKKYLEKAKHVCLRADTEPGLNFCYGLYHWRIGEPSVAIKHFNKARRDSQFGERALSAMIHILLNPTGVVIGSQAYITMRAKESDAESLGTIKMLIQELRDMASNSSKEVDVLSAYYTLVSTNDKSGKLGGAIDTFTQLVQSDKTNLDAQLGLAQCYAIVKAYPKARAGLKQLLRIQWLAEKAEVFENAWLLMADLYVQQGKHGDAQEHLQKCLAHNKSCGKGWELMGRILEKELAYENASGFYENAWAYGNGSDPAIGYKLAFNLLKAKKCLEAIDICHAVLEKNPDYKGIKKDVMDVARKMIRT